MPKLQTLSDQELIEKIIHQDKELYRELVRRYQQQLLRYAQYLVRDYEKAQDVVQEAFVKAFINLQGYNPKLKFSSWIFRIVHNEAINIVKKHQKETRLDETNDHQILAPVETEVEEIVRKKEDQQIVQTSLAEIPLLYREPLTLFYLEELSYEEISDVLRIPIGTVGIRIKRGKTMMKMIYQKITQNGSRRTK